MTPDRQIILLAARFSAVGIAYHGIATWRIRSSCPWLRDCLHERCVPTWCGSIPEPSSCPPQLSVDLARFQHCMGCLLCTIVVYNEDASSVTCALFSRPPAVAVHVSFSCLPGFMKAALICLTLLLSYATLTGGVEMWGWDESFIYSVAMLLPKTLSTNQVSESGDLVAAFLMFWSFEVMSHSWWTGS